jgi:hypothetical protein
MTNGELERIREVKNRYQDELLKKKNVVGLGIGYKETAGRQTDQLSLIVMVRKKEPLSNLNPSDVVPPQIEDVITDVQEVGEIRAL